MRQTLNITRNLHAQLLNSVLEIVMSNVYISLLITVGLISPVCTVEYYDLLSHCVAAVLLQYPGNAHLWLQVQSEDRDWRHSTRQEEL